MTVDEQQMGGHTPKWAVKYAALIEQRDRLREALKKYGQHKTICATARGDRCDCGLNAALALGNTK